MRKKKNALGYTYLAPALISILLVTCLPIIYTVILSFTNYNMYHLNDYSYVGWENYRTVFSGSIKSVFFPVLGWTGVLRSAQHGRGICYGTGTCHFIE